MIKKTRETAAYRRVASELKRLLTDGMVIEGTLAEIRSGSAVHYQLTRKVKGRTQTDYVPLARKGDVEDWTRRWKEAKALFKALSDSSRSILRSSAPSREKTGGRQKGFKRAGRRRRSRRHPALLESLQSQDFALSAFG